VALRLFDDRRALIAAGKVQRWEVTKWAVTANVALAAASAATGEFHVMFFALAVFIAATACLLLWHYNLRMTRVRQSLRSINTFISESVIDFEFVSKTNFLREKNERYDLQEMCIFYAVTMLSTLPCLLAIWKTR
jgi:hypothetical protein